MDNIEIVLDEEGKGTFIITKSGEKLGEMKVGVSGNRLTIYHTEIVPAAEGQGFGKQLLQAAVKHARSNALKIKTLCIFVYNQFRKHPDTYNDIWQKSE
jgi:predicted GNAT family acetyltransferase